MDAKTLKLKRLKLLQFYNHIPYNMECAGDFLKVLLKFKMAATDQIQFSWGRKKMKH